jgi:hypothetical protein
VEPDFERRLIIAALSELGYEDLDWSPAQLLSLRNLLRRVIDFRSSASAPQTWPARADADGWFPLPAADRED